MACMSFRGRMPFPTEAIFTSDRIVSCGQVISPIDRRLPRREKHPARNDIHTICHCEGGCPFPTEAIFDPVMIVSHGLETLPVNRRLPRREKHPARNDTYPILIPVKFIKFFLQFLHNFYIPSGYSMRVTSENVSKFF
jgi:hypothetical protein